MSAAPQNPETPERPRLLTPAAGAAIGSGIAWLIFLVWLTLATSNPVTLNREQVLRAGFIIRTRISGADADCEVLECWPDGAAHGSIRVRNLPVTGIRSDEDYLVPITRRRGEFVATPTHLPGREPLVYPATDVSIAQLEALLGT